LKELAQKSGGFYSSKDVFKRVEPLEESVLGRASGKAMEDDMFLGVWILLAPEAWVCRRDVLAWTDLVIVCCRSEVCGVCCVEAMTYSESEDGRCDEVVVSSGSGLDSRRGFVCVRGVTHDVGEVIRWGIILPDFHPHCVFGKGEGQGGGTSCEIV